mmetsp:Transcript_35376/g.43321  ORF Transcript_35376/g.43321 Transcript_35376/m.43321 type:complete len:946 (+) Transcript_35376:129-2966(+)
MGNAQSGNTASSILHEASSSITSAAGLACGNIADALDEKHNSQAKRRPPENGNRPSSPMLMMPTDFCNSHNGVGSPPSSRPQTNEQDDDSSRIHPTSALFARALISEVTDNPRTMTPEAMAAREKMLLQAQSKDRKNAVSKLMGTLKYHLDGGGSNDPTKPSNASMSYPPNQLNENRAQLGVDDVIPGKHTVTIGLSLSRRHSTLGHPDTVTRQTAFDFNELQDRNYKYVSSTDASGWRAGGGKEGSPPPQNSADADDYHHKIASPDTVHIPIIQIDADSPAAVDNIISALARGELFIPHMSVLPEALSVNGVSPPDLIVRFGCERNDDLPPEEWPNWTLEFMHNQLYDFFQSSGARWMKRPFQITLARKVRWRTVKHMNKFFAHSERVISAWREKGPQYLNPQLSYIEGGATPEEVARPHGIYLLRDGRPTNYFAPNFEPPYTTKMTRSLLLNVLEKSWDKKRRDWVSNAPVPRIMPGMLFCGCEMRNVDSPRAANNKSNNVRLGVAETLVRDGSGSALSRRSFETTSTSPKGVTDNEVIAREVNSSANGKTSPKVVPTQQYNSDQQTSTSPTSSISQQQEPTPRDNIGADNIQQSQFTPTLSSSTESNTLDESKDPAKIKTSRSNSADSPSSGKRQQNEESKKKKKNKSKARQIQTDDKKDEAPVDMGSSIGESHTTIPISNASPRLLERERERRKQRELEMLKEREKMEQIEEAIRKRKEGRAKDEEEEKERLRETAREKEEKARKKKEKQKFLLKQINSKTTTNYIQNSTPTMQNTHAKPPKTEDSAHFSFNDQQNQTPTSNHSSISNHPIPLMRSHSQNSLEYSVDSLSIGHFRSDASVATANTANTANQSLLSYITRSTVDDSTTDRKHFLLDDEKSCSEDVPSDEELFSIGWAKALDVNSGSYYYFTLDRSKIVWDNPLVDVPNLTRSSGSSSNGIRA